MSVAIDRTKPVEQGVRPCRECGRPHWSYEAEGFAPQWADPDDGHAYLPEPWEKTVQRLLDELGRETVLP